MIAVDTYFLLSERSMLIPDFMVLKGPFLLLPELKRTENIKPKPLRQKYLVDAKSYLLL
jgi:hypothetical protein